jgi:uncharacterized protein
MYVEDVTPFYFGEDQALFGLYHAPQPDQNRDTAVLLCASMGQEYIRAHRANRQLAVRLARAGFPTMRFDYYASGDSAGDDNQVSITRWQADISTAITELKRRSGVGQVSLMGMRIGATLASIVGEQRGDIARLVAWEPLISGNDFIEDLIERHEESLRYFLNKPAAESQKEKRTELLGFAFTQSLFDELRQIDLLALRRKPAQSVLVIERQAQAQVASFQAYLESLGAVSHYQIVESPRIWAEDPDKALVPQQVLQTIMNWMTTS